MTHRAIRVLMMGSLLAARLQTAWATEQGRSSMGQSVPTASPTQAQATDHPAQAASTQPMASERVQGSITALDLMATRPSMKLSAAGGKSWTFELDPKSTVVWKEGHAAPFNQLRTGQSAEVRHAVIGGNDVAQFVRILGTKPLASSITKPRRSY